LALVPEHEPLEFESCDVCERTLLVGERSWRYLAPSGDMRTVCTLCKSRAEVSGWVPEALAGTASWSTQRPRRRRFGAGGRMAEVAARVRRGIAPSVADNPERTEEPEPAPRYAASSELAPEPGPDDQPEPEPEPPALDDDPSEHPSDPPPVLSGDQVIDEALRVFNASDEQRQVGGLRRTLGTPRVSVQQSPDGRDAAVIVIAWDLSWYEWEVQIGDGQAAVTEVRKGSEVAELGEPSPDWNAALDEEDLVTLAPA
jgi:hypothetical protein